MVDYRKLLDAVVGALAKPDGGSPAGGPSDLAHQLQTGATSLAPVLDKAKELAAKHPVLTQAALLGLAGLMFGRRKKGGIAGGIAKLGGLAVIGGLAYKAYQNQKGGQFAAASIHGSDNESSGRGAGDGLQDVPETSRFHPVSQTEDDAMLFLRTMVAAAAADGQIDHIERARIIRGLTEAGIDPEASRWLDREMQAPMGVDELADGVEDPELAAQVYAAALLAIDPDTLQEHEFLRQLAEALDLDQNLRRQIEETIDAAR
ncbi:tellurite resistance TerB family protein [Microvirga puerhi]|uniref:Tellurite resistance TerB family protein n=1 Tax=Microvirga puerhi TaxID=2876078 RepID=A0ABS7VPF2_9HYPH|nr:tellurite resistance TerB family protein [Microvirga puerhi]MBZ6077434.1 tellurite resistance TerB family protein [Microvirga puerhi]